MKKVVPEESDQDKCFGQVDTTFDSNDYYLTTIIYLYRVDVMDVNDI